MRFAAVWTALQQVERLPVCFLFTAILDINDDQADHGIDEIRIKR